MSEYGIVMAYSGNWVEESLSFYSATCRIYVFQTQKIFSILYKKTSWYKKVAPAYVGVMENTFDGNCIILEVKPLLDITQWSFHYWDSFEQEYCIR